MFLRDRTNPCRQVPRRKHVDPDLERQPIVSKSQMFNMMGSTTEYVDARHATEIVLMVESPQEIEFIADGSKEEKGLKTPVAER